MNKTLLISGVLLALTASVASAGGVNLTWNDCYGGGGVSNRAFACNSNDGNNDLYVTFEPDENIPDVYGSNPIIDLRSASTDLPAWWRFRHAGTCRQASLSALTSPTGTCTDTWAGQGVASVAAYFTQANAPQVVPAPNRARILSSVSVPEAFAANVDPGTEYFCLLIRINNAKTVGTDSCAGCQVPVCLVVSEILLVSINSGDHRLFAPIGNNLAYWQSSPFYTCIDTPTLNRTWGQVKSLYR
jgi:hypothetical protein